MNVLRTHTEELWCGEGEGAQKVSHRKRHLNCNGDRNRRKLVHKHMLERERERMQMYESKRNTVQAYLRDTAGSVPDKSSTIIKQVTQIFWISSAYKKLHLGVPVVAQRKRI